MRLLVTRPLDDAQALAERLAARGHAATVEPLLTIAPDLRAPLDLSGIHALVFTSANGVRAYALRSPRRDLPVFAVGAATAAAAREIGFANVASAEGDVAALEETIAARVSPAEGPLLHVAGAVVAGDLAGRLAARGYTLRRATLYAAEPAPRLSAAAQAALEGGTLDGVLLFSPRSAAIFVELTAAPALRAAVGRLTLFALSPAVAQAAAAAGWRRVVVAPQPDEPALLDLIDAEAAAGAAGTQEATAMAETPPAPTAAAAPPPAARAGAPWPVLVVGVVAVVALVLDVYTLAGAPRREAVRRDTEQAVSQRFERLEREVAALAALRQERDEAVQSARRLEARLTAAAALLETLGGRLDALDRDLRAEIARAAATTPPAAAPDPALFAALAEDLQRVREEVAALRAPPLASAAPAPVATPAPAAAAAPPPPPPAAAAAAAALRRVEAAAAAAPPDLAALRADLARLAPQVLRAAGAASSGGSGWWSALTDRVAALIAVRRVGEIRGEDAEALLARAEQRLAAGDIAAALDILAALPPAPAERLAPWTAAARARVELDAALADLARAAGGRP
jgi:uroporphyrinogen-III synthase